MTGPMHTEFWHFPVALLAGLILGLFYFGGLWLTVRRVPASARPHRLVLGSFMLRLLIVLAGFYSMTAWGWQALATALLGLVITRQLLIRSRKYLSRATAAD